MNAFRRAARVVADEGFAALIRRLGGKLLRRAGRQEPAGDGDPAVAEAPAPLGEAPAAPVVTVPPAVTAPAPSPPTGEICSPAQRVLQAMAEPDELAEARAEYEQQSIEFRHRTHRLGWKGLEHYYWYHTVDLGDGLVTPGDHDFRGLLPSFGFPESMAGMRVLDIGSATGFFAFEFERRGAEVVSVELPSMNEWDILGDERERVTRECMGWLKASTPEESYRRHLDGPFQFCRSVLDSRVQRCYSSVYDLNLAKLGGAKFDLVYAGDLLLHLFAPFKALEVLSRLCCGSLVATVDANFPGPTDRPLMSFLGCHSEQVDRRTWWAVNAECVKDMLKRLGFPAAWVSGRYAGIVRRAWFPFSREVVWASKTGQPAGAACG